MEIHTVQSRTQTKVQNDAVVIRGTYFPRFFHRYSLRHTTVAMRRLVHFSVDRSESCIHP
jgi:hypothetical protein